MKFREITRLPRQFLWAIAMEGVGTTRMIHVYARHVTRNLNLRSPQQNPSSEELQVAGEQLKDIPRSLLFLVVFLIPVPGFVGGYTLAAISMEKWSGDKIKLIPSRFRKLLIQEKKA